MLSFEDVHRASGSNRSFYRPFDHDENVDDDLDEYFHQPEKKRRLTVEQVQFLEKSFEVENKLEPERKIQLAKDLGLQPRQVAIWFQNRRARWKTKQLEKDYDVLQTKYNTLKSDYENLLREREKSQSQVLDLTDKLKAKEEEEKTGQSKTEPTSEEKETELPPPPEKPVNNTEPESISAKSDIFDSDSPHYTDGVHSSLLETGDSSYVFEPDQSDLSQDEDDNLISKTLLQPYIFPKLEEVDYDYSDPPTTTASCNLGFPVEDHAFWSWSY